MTHVNQKAGLLFAALVFSAVTSGAARAQGAASSDAKPAAPPATEGGGLASLAWLEGCWRGSVNQREYREQWMPLRGNLMVGVSQTVVEGKTQDYEFLRIEPRPDGLYYVATSPGKPETAFRFVDETVDRERDRNDHVFSFGNAAVEFPQKIVYRRASEGWLYASVEGKVNGVDRQVIYPMRRIGCESGDVIAK